METVTKEYTIYTFEELNREAKQEALRQHCVFEEEVFDFSQAQYILKDRVDRLNIIGFSNAKIEYSGFSSQECGASFSSDVDLEKIIAYLGDKKFYRLIPLAREGYFEFSIVKNSYGNFYCHEKTKYISVDRCDLMTCRSFRYDRKPRRSKLARLNGLIDELEQTVEQLRLKESKAIYKELEDAYLFVTSEEYLIDIIETNGYRFFSNGKIFY